MMDLKNIKTQRKDLLFRGAMGTTGSKSNTSPLWSICCVLALGNPLLLQPRPPLRLSDMAC
jgi:hypothetical protein